MKLAIHEGLAVPLQEGLQIESALFWESVSNRRCEGGGKGIY